MTRKEKLWKTFEANKHALMTNDLEILKKTYAKDYRGFNMRGEPGTRDLILQIYAPGMARLNAFETENETAEVIGDVGIITGRGFISGSFQEQPFEHHLHFVDILIWRDEQWQYYLSHSTEIQGRE